VKLEDIEVTEEELLAHLPHPLMIKPMSREKAEKFVEHMRELIRARKFKDLQNKQNDI
jgi:hypothetical protein